MANWNPLFQGYPCDFSYHEALKANTLPAGKNLQLYTVLVTPLKKDGTGEDPNDRVLRIITNAWVKDTTMLVHRPSNTQYSVPVDTLATLSVTDEIDPCMLENKIPSAMFSFKTESLNENSTLNEVNAFLDSFKDNVIAIGDDFVNTPMSMIRNVDGQANLSFSQYFGQFMDRQYTQQHILGYYIIDKVDFDYETAQITVSMFSYLFKRMNDELFFDKASAMYPDCHVKVPHNASTTTSSVGYALNYDQFNTLAKIYPRYPNAVQDSRVKSCGDFTDNNFPLIDPRAIVSGLSTQHLRYNTSSFTRRMAYHYCRPSAASSFPSVSRIPSYENNTDLIPMFYFLNDESIYDVVKVTCLQNNMWLLPMGRKGTNLESDTRVGVWQIISGLRPNENPFLDTTVTVPSDTGTYYPFKADTPYRVFPSMIKEKSRTKKDLGIEPVEYIKSYNIPLDITYISVTEDLATTSTPQNVSLETLNFDEFPSSISPSTDIDVDGKPSTIIKPLGPTLEILTYPSANLIPLDEGFWYDNHTTVDDGYIVGSDGNLIANDLWYRGGSTTQRIANMVEGRNALNFRALYNPDSKWRFLNSGTQSIYAKRPFRANIRKVAPIASYQDIDGNMLSDASGDVKAIDSLHNMTGVQGLPKKVLTRANLTEFTPMYRLTWSMLDDPTLRVGTLVYVPLQNQYVKCFITKQTRSFDGGSILECEGIVTSETTEKVFDPALSECKCAYYVVNPDNSPKGEWLDFTWKQHPSWDGITQNVYYEFGFQPNSGAYYKIGEIILGSTEPNRYLLNVPDAEEKYGVNIDTTGTKGVYQIKAVYGSWNLESTEPCTFTASAWDNAKFSELYVGYLRASNEHQPLIVGNPLQG